MGDGLEEGGEEGGGGGVVIGDVGWWVDVARMVGSV